MNQERGERDTHGRPGIDRQVWRGVAIGITLSVLAFWIPLFWWWFG